MGSTKKRTNGESTHLCQVKWCKQNLLIYYYFVVSVCRVQKSAFIFAFHFSVMIKCDLFYFIIDANQIELNHTNYYSSHYKDQMWSNLKVNRRIKKHYITFNWSGSHFHFKETLSLNFKPITSIVHNSHHNDNVV